MNALRSLFGALWKQRAMVFARWEVCIMRLLFALVFFDAGSRLMDVPARVEADPAHRVAPALASVVTDGLAVMPEVSEFKGQPKPHGIAWLLAKVHGPKFTFFSDPATARLIYRGMYVALVFYVLGVGLPVALGYLFVVMVMHGTYLNSQGSIHHHLQLFTLVLGAQWIASLLALRRGKGAGAAALWRLDAASSSRLAQWTLQVIAAGYVVSALSKFAESKGTWMFRTPRLGVQLAKATDQDYYDHLRHSTQGHEWLPAWCVENPWLARAVFGPALLLEFFAFLMLRNRTLSATYALALIAFHVSVSALMSLDFRYNVQMMLVFAVNVPFWLWWLAKGRKRWVDSAPA